MKKLLVNFLMFIFICNSCFALSLDEKIGQLIIVGFNGSDINSSDFKRTLKEIQNKEISGVILFSKNIKDKENLILMNKKIQSSSEIKRFNLHQIYLFLFQLIMKADISRGLILQILNPQKKFQIYLLMKQKKNIQKWPKF